MRKNSIITIIIAIISIMSGVVISKPVQKTYAYDCCEIVIEQSTGRVLYSHEADVRRPMASTTKIITAITAIENFKGKLNDMVIVPDCAVGIEGSSVYLKKGEKLEFIDLLYGLMLRSGNDCAVSIAVIVGGSVENFAVMMNDTAVKAGAGNSNFVNPHGLHDDRHYTTARDLAKITAYAMNNSVFCDIVSTQKYVSSRTGENTEKVFLNKNKLLHSFEGANGVKTGYTKKAGRCLVSSATRDGMTVIAVALNCPPMFEECSRLMEKAFGEYEMCNLIPPGILTYCKIIGEERFVPLKAGSEYFYPVKKDGSERIGYEISDVKELNIFPEISVSNGKLNIYLDKRLIFFTKLVTI